MTETGTVTVSRYGAIPTVVLDCQRRLSALAPAMWSRLADPFRKLSADVAMRCVVLRDSGGRSFAAGIDISTFKRERNSRDSPGLCPDDPCRARGNRHLPASGHRRDRGYLRRRRRAGAGGRCDLRIWGRSSRFGTPVKRLGLTVAHDEIQALPGLVSPTTASKILLAGRVFGADEALAKGLVTHAVDDADIAGEALRTAARIAERAPLMPRWHKTFVHRPRDPQPSSEAEREAAYACFAAENPRRAFLAKGTPEFIGR